MEVSPDFIRRLIDFYQRQPVPNVTHIWKSVSEKYHVDLINALDSSDLGKTQTVLENIFSNDLIFGLGWSQIIAESYPDLWRTSLQDKLERLAKSIGVLRYKNPGQPEENVAPPDFSWLLNMCDREFDKSIDLKGRGFGESINDRCISVELLEYLAIKRCAELQNKDLNNWFEIGAGLGTLGRLVNHYSTSDLPICSVIHSYLIATSKGESNVWLSGEDYQNQPVRIYGVNPPSDLIFDVVINQNSMPEMPVDTMVGYLKWINDHLSPDGFFLSINHESHRGGQVSVNECAKRIMSLTHRSEWCMMPGYVEEIWKKK